MPEPKTRRTTASVKDFIATVPDERRRKDATAVMKMMAEVTGEKAAMWGSSIIGFGRLRYKYASGREGDWFRAGLAPRKDAFTLYLCGGFADHKDLLEKLGKHRTGVGCLYVKKLADVDQKVLKQLIVKASRSLPK